MPGDGEPWRKLLEFPSGSDLQSPLISQLTSDGWTGRFNKPKTVIERIGII